VALSKSQTGRIEDVLRLSLRHKLANYQPEPNSMPFHTRLLGKDRLALFSFIHSLNTNFGTTIFEPVAIEISLPRFKNASRKVRAGEKMSEQAQSEIQRIMDSLSTAESEPNKPEEIERIRRVCQKGKLATVKPTEVDLAVESKAGELFLFDIKTAKPNAGGFKEFKRTLLEWVACTLADRPDAKVNTAVAIPYNPYAPRPYSRWTIRGMLDLKNELLVAEEFWDFLGGSGTFDDLLNIFERVGIELRPEIDTAFEKFK
jgi:type II restriction enzyme